MRADYKKKKKKMNTQQKISWLKNHHKPNWIDKLIYTGTRKNAAQTGKIRT